MNQGILRCRLPFRSTTAYNSRRYSNEYAFSYFSTKRKDSVMRSKITVVGAGFVGSTLVQRLVERDYADVVMYDIVPNMPQGKALDMLQAGPVQGHDSLVVGINDYAGQANFDLVGYSCGI